MGERGSSICWLTPYSVPELGTRKPSDSLIKETDDYMLGPSSTTFPGTLTKAGSQVERLGLEPVLLWDAVGAVDTSFLMPCLLAVL